MNLLKTAFKVVIFAVVAVAVLTIAGKVRQASARNGGAAASAEEQTGDKLSAAGFFLLSRDDAKNPNVVIMSPPNCPSHEAQRARALGDSLAQAGIPHEMRSGIQFQFNNPDDVARVNKYMTDVANPLVLVRGWARGNPSLDQVIAQYRAAH
jgi:hypothetical protein